MTIAIGRRFAALVALGGLIGILHLAGQAMGAVAPSQALATAEQDPVLVAASALRIFAMAGCLWLIAITTIDTMAVVLQVHPLRSLTLRLAPAAWRTMVLRPIAAVSLVLPPVALPVMTAVPAIAAPASVGVAESGEQAQLEMVVFRADPPVLTMTVAADGPTELPPDSPPVADSDGSASSATHVVGSGENLWSIATAYLTDQLERPPTPSEATNYWHQVIETNRGNLPDPSVPDLIYPGVELRMPPVAWDQVSIS